MIDFLKNLTIKNILTFFGFCLLILGSMARLAAEQTKRVIGGEAGWEEIQTMSGVTTGKGRFGYKAIQLVTSSAETSPYTDLMLTMDGSALRDEMGNYTVEENHLVSSEKYVRGKGSALSRGEGVGLTLRGSSRALFGRTGLMGSFTIEFWLNPSIAENGEEVFSWRSSRTVGSNLKYQMISAGFFNNHLEWKFTNIFEGYSSSEVELLGYTPIIPDDWTRHTLSFNEESGLLEYCVDGKTEAICYITTTGHENGTVCHPVLGVRSSIEICPRYTGYIDDFRIEKTSFEKTADKLYTSGNETYRVDGGSFVTKPILVSNAASLDKVHALMNVPAQTEIRLYVRSGDNCFGWTDSYPQWKEIFSDEALSGVTGQYFQLYAELLPDGGGTKSPSITELDLYLTEQPLPLAPFTVKAVPGNGSVTLTWSYSLDDTAGGYYVYYGNKSGEYLGRQAVEGPSPIKVGNTTSLTLTGLKNGTIYYFAVSAYSRIDGRINGLLSKEVYARPSATVRK